jgi:predicted transcriptional regulator
MTNSAPKPEKTARADNLSVRLPVEMREKVDELARVTRRSRSFIINEAVASYIRSRAEFFEDIEAAVKEAEAGKGHSKEQVFDWMDDLADGRRRPLPAPDLRSRK